MSGNRNDVRGVVRWLAVAAALGGGLAAAGAGGDAVAVASPVATLVVGEGMSKSSRWLAMYAGAAQDASRAPRTSVRAVTARARTLRVMARPWLSRSATDRPEPNIVDIKPICVTFRDGADDRHDVNGLVAQMASSTCSCP